MTAAAAASALLLGGLVLITAPLGASGEEVCVYEACKAKSGFDPMSMASFADFTSLPTNMKCFLDCCLARTIGTRVLPAVDSLPFMKMLPQKFQDIYQQVVEQCNPKARAEEQSEAGEEEEEEGCSEGAALVMCVGKVIMNSVAISVATSVMG